MTTSQTAQQTLYYAPYNGAYCPVYNGTQQQLYQFTSSSSDTVGQSLSLAGSANWTTQTLYDVFYAYVGGTLFFGTGPAWTNTTTRSASLALYNGVQTNSASMTLRTGAAATQTVPANQGTYLGTIYTSAAGQISFTFGGAASGGSAGLLGVWNMYNRVNVGTTVTDSGTSYTYALATIRQARGSTGNQVQFVSGLAEDSIQTGYTFAGFPAAVVVAGQTMGIGLDATSSFTSAPFLVQAPNTAQAEFSGSVFYGIAPQIGFHTVSANEKADGTNSSNFDGTSTNQLTFSLRM